MGIKSKKNIKVIVPKQKGFENLKKSEQRFIRKQVRAMFCVTTKYIKKKKIIVFSDNISMGGVFLETFDPLPAGTKLILKFPFKSVLRPIQIEGKVIWSRQDIEKDKLGNKAPGMAIAFENLKRKDINFMKEFLDNTTSYGWFLE